MKTENSILMKHARESLLGKWGVAVGAYAIYWLINIVINKLRGIGIVVSFVVSGPLLLGLTIFSLSLSRNKSGIKVSKIFDGFNDFVRSLKAYLLVAFFTLLWSLLLIVPGIVAAISYAQVFFILADDKTIGAKDALEKSKKMMYGYKWKYFCLCFRFTGWILLSILTLGIGLLWVVPYMQVTLAKFYDDLLGNEKTVV